ncbi:MAG: hypothetical protein ACOX7W_00265 [Christensenellales bacterium]
MRLGPRRPIGSNMPPQNPPQDPSPEDMAGSNKTPSARYRVYLSTIRAHDEAVARVQRRSREQTAPEQPTDQS